MNNQPGRKNPRKETTVVREKIATTRNLKREKKITFFNLGFLPLGKDLPEE